MGQWASEPESWGPSWDPPRKKKKKRKKERVFEFFFTEAVNTVVMWCSWFNAHCYHTVEKKIVFYMTTRNRKFLINKHKETTLPKSLFCVLEEYIWAAKLLALFTHLQLTVNIQFSVSYDCNMQLAKLQKNYTSIVPALKQISTQEVQSKYCKNDKNVKNLKIWKIRTNFVTCND